MSCVWAWAQKDGLWPVPRLTTGHSSSPKAILGAAQSGLSQSSMAHFCHWPVSGQAVEGAGREVEPVTQSPLVASVHGAPP